ncbi:hypothetical protein FRX31_003559 [Thalictrum thalictroides]|uniref:Uncharacterized protein n=1 Tax=Thalictrum thalictroides TaxID=46969 RepID=A0A7J6XBI7_THATH|nr:hypothetical protein FRX31_003559 [Thalictrum thalictroides]
MKYDWQNQSFHSPMGSSFRSRKFWTFTNFIQTTPDLKSKHASNIFILTILGLMMPKTITDPQTRALPKKSNHL